MLNVNRLINDFKRLATVLIFLLGALMVGPIQIAPPLALAQTCEQHDFGYSNVQIYVYSDGRSWNFTAQSDMTVKTVEVKSVLASNGGTFHIQVRVNGNTVASWDRYVNSTTYQPYYDSANVSLDIQAGDTITYFIYGGTMSTPVGGITGVNYVKLCPDRFVYLPLVLKAYSPPTPPAAPTLNVINNPDGDGNYTISWSTVNGATSYTLAEDDNASFSSPTQVYAGSGTSHAVNGKTAGTYYYRVKASNAGGSSGWSNPPQSVVVSVASLCPQTGSWSGTTNQSLSISFRVSNATTCQVESLTLWYRATCTYGTVLRGEGLGTASIVNNHFSVSGVSGNFTTSTAANGTFNKTFVDPVVGTCYGSGTWTANYNP